MSDWQAYATRRMREGASDVDVRLELLERDVPAELIEQVMRAASPRRSVHLWPLLAGTAIAIVGAVSFVASAAGAIPFGRTMSIAICAAGAALIGRGLMPR
jgi:CHASE2 domain-containing sensor protein